MLDYLPPIVLIPGAILLIVAIGAFSGFKQGLKNMKICPECQMKVRIDATKCRHCLTALKK
jgi:ribosomal protein L40E